MRICLPYSDKVLVLQTPRQLETYERWRAERQAEALKCEEQLRKLIDGADKPPLYAPEP